MEENKNSLAEFSNVFRSGVVTRLWEVHTPKIDGVRQFLALGWQQSHITSSSLKTTIQWKIYQSRG